MLWNDYAHFRSVVSKSAVDAAGNPLPWYTYPAIEYLSQLDFSDRSVFEYGSGMSTLFWAGVARRVVSVEDDEQWFETIAAKVPSNASITLESDLSRFPSAITDAGSFDVIVVDGPARGRTRLKCCHAALAALAEGGLIILDNSDWLPESSRLLRESGLLEVDFTGFAPICGHVQTTSLYFHRAFNVTPITARQPMPGRGSQPKVWEQPMVPVPGAVVACDGEDFRGVFDELTFEIPTGTGARTFRALSYLGGDNGLCIAILDLDRGRVLLTRHRPSTSAQSDRAIAQEMARIAALSWENYRAFVGGHEYRRYVL